MGSSHLVDANKMVAGLWLRAATFFTVRSSKFSCVLAQMTPRRALREAPPWEPAPCTKNFFINLNVVSYEAEKRTAATPVANNIQVQLPAEGKRCSDGQPYDVPFRLSITTAVFRTRLRTCSEAFNPIRAVVGGHKKRPHSQV